MSSTMFALDLLLYGEFTMLAALGPSGVSPISVSCLGVVLVSNVDNTVFVFLRLKLRSSVGAAHRLPTRPSPQPAPKCLWKYEM